MRLEYWTTVNHCKGFISNPFLSKKKSEKSKGNNDSEEYKREESDYSESNKEKNLEKDRSGENKESKIKGNEINHNLWAKNLVDVSLCFR